MLERRRHERQASEEPARIVFDEPESTMECTIRDRSDDGACVEVANTRLIPSQFKLVLSSGANPVLSGSLANAKQNWRGVCVGALVRR